MMSVFMEIIPYLSFFFNRAYPRAGNFDLDNFPFVHYNAGKALTGCQ